MNELGCNLEEYIMPTGVQIYSVKWIMFWMYRERIDYKELTKG